MSFLIQARFNSNGPSIGNNGGGVSFKDTSPCKNGDKCITFTAYDKQATYTINKSIILQNDFTIYLKFKINKELMDDSFNTPIISYMRPNDNYNYPFLFIQQKKYFSILLNENEGCSSTIIDYAFDNKWHTLCITRKNNKIKFFLDGFCLTTNESTTLVDLGNQIRIGFKSEDSIYTSFFNGGKMDDICILDTAIYFDNFVPPTLYFTGSDSSSNYYENRIYNIDNLSNDVKKAIERKMESRSSRLNRAQHRILPRRLRIRWNESNWYFKDMKYTRVPSNFQHTIINLYGIENPIYGNDHIRFFEGYADELIKNNKMQPFMLFLNKNFIPLSKLYIIRSDWFYTVMIKDRDPDIAGKINSIEMVTIPFPIIYEEGLEEKEDQRALYVFDKNGKFNPQSGYIYYYIDRNRVGDYLEFNGILDQYIPTEDESNGDNNQNNYSDSMFLHSVWRYGKFDEVDIDGNNANVTFVDSEDPSRGWIRSDTEILIYKNGTLWDKSRYRIIGENRIQFINYKEEDLSDNLITIQIITDTRTSIIEDLTNMKVVTVDAVTDKQSVFNIPELETGDGIPYRFFLIFRGSVCMNNRDRFVISDDYKTITFTNTEDFVDKGTSIYFCFLKLRKSDIYGSLHVKPIFLYTKTDQFDELNPSSHDYIIPIPDLNGLEFNKNNTILFVGDVFISPYSYKIENNRIITTQPGFGFSHNRNVTIVCLKMANRFEDPLDDIDKIIKDENDKGKRYVLYDLNIDKWHKITLDNFVCFDNDGTYIPDLFGEVYNRNIIKGLFTSEPLKRVPRYLTCIWDKRSLLNEANTLLPTNDDYISSYILLRNEFFELDDEFENFMSDFEIEHSRDKHYGENLAKALDYMISYNQNKLDEAFYRRKVISRFKLNTDQINKNLIEIQDSKKSIQYQWIIDRDEYYDNYNRTFVMVFVNGIIPIWYNTIKYDLNLVKFVLPNKFNSSDIIELLMFHKINNFLEKLENKVGYGGGNKIEQLINANTKINKEYLEPKPVINGNFIYNKGNFETFISSNNFQYKKGNTDITNPIIINSSLNIEKQFMDEENPNLNIFSTINYENQILNRDIDCDVNLENPNVNITFKGKMNDEYQDWDNIMSNLDFDYNKLIPNKIEIKKGISIDDLKTFISKYQQIDYEDYSDRKEWISSSHSTTSKLNIGHMKFISFSQDSISDIQSDIEIEVIYELEANFCAMFSESGSILLSENSGKTTTITSTSEMPEREELIKKYINLNANVIDLSYIFATCINLTIITSNLFDNIRTKTLQDISAMYLYCYNLQDFNLLTKINTHNVIYAKKVFGFCLNLVNTDFIENLDLSSCKDIRQFFCGCINLTKINTSKWDLTNLENASYMYSLYSGLEIIGMNFGDSLISKLSEFGFTSDNSSEFINSKTYDLKISTNTSEKLSNIYGMFDSISSLVENIDISELKINKENLDCESLFKSIESINIVTTTISTIYINQLEINKIKSISLPIDLKYYQGEISLGYAFNSLSSLEIINNIDVLNNIKITNLGFAFNDNNNLITDLSKINFSYCRSFESTFCDCEQPSVFGEKGIISIKPAENFELYHSCFERTFKNCSGIKVFEFLMNETNEPLKTSFYYATSGNNTFYNSNIETVDISGLSTENIQRMSYFFYNCANLKEVKGIFDFKMCSEYYKFLPENSNLKIKFKNVPDDFPNTSLSNIDSNNYEIIE